LLQPKVLREQAIAAAHGGLAEAEEPAGLHGAAAQLQEIEQADVLQQLRNAVGLRGAREGIDECGHGGLAGSLQAASGWWTRYEQFFLRKSKRI
jgi:hypothetical protein